MIPTKNEIAKTLELLEEELAESAFQAFAHLVLYAGLGAFVNTHTRQS